MSDSWLILPQLPLASQNIGLAATATSDRVRITSASLGLEHRSRSCRPAEGRRRAAGPRWSLRSALVLNSVARPAKAVNVGDSWFAEDPDHISDYRLNGDDHVFREPVVRPQDGGH